MCKDSVISFDHAIRMLDGALHIPVAYLCHFLVSRPAKIGIGEGELSCPVMARALEHHLTHFQLWRFFVLLGLPFVGFDDRDSRFLARSVLDALLSPQDCIERLRDICSRCSGGLEAKRMEKLVESVYDLLIEVRPVRLK
jgi:hypothetical protein